MAFAARRIREPLFLEVRRALLETLRTHGYRPGERLPAEPELASAYGVSRPTMREVLRSLETDGLVRRVHGVGTFVTQAEPVVTSRLDVDLGVTEAVAAANRRLGVQVLRVTHVHAPEAIAQQLEIPLGAELLWVERLIRANDVAAAHAVDTIPVSLTAGAHDPDYRGGSIYRFLELQCGITLAGGVAHVSAVNADRALAMVLGVSPGAPLLRLDQVERAHDGRPVLYSREHYVSNVFDLSVRRVRHGDAEPLSVEPRKEG